MEAVVYNAFGSDLNIQNQLPQKMHYTKLKTLTNMSHSKTFMFASNIPRIHIHKIYIFLIMLTHDMCMKITITVECILYNMWDYGWTV